MLLSTATYQTRFACLKSPIPISSSLHSLFREGVFEGSSDLLHWKAPPAVSVDVGSSAVQSSGNWGLNRMHSSTVQLETTNVAQKMRFFCNRSTFVLQFLISEMDYKSALKMN